MKRRQKVDWLDRRIAAPGPYLCLCLDEPSFHAALADCGIKSRPDFMASPHSNATVHFLENHGGNLVCIVALGPCGGRTPVEVAGLLVHEAVHVWQRHCERIGEHRPGDEQAAYGIQAIAQELMQSFSEQTC
jgi:hypothetical protein